MTSPAVGGKSDRVRFVLDGNSGSRLFGRGTIEGALTASPATTAAVMITNDLRHILQPTSVLWRLDGGRC